MLICKDYVAHAGLKLSQKPRFHTECSGMYVLVLANCTVADTVVTWGEVSQCYCNLQSTIVQDEQVVHV